MCSDYSAFTEMQQNEITVDLDSFWGHFSGTLNIASTIKFMFKEESILWHHFLNNFLIVILQQFTFAHTEHVLILEEKKKNFDSTSPAFSSYVAKQFSVWDGF